MHRDAVLQHLAECKREPQRHALPLAFDGFACQLVPLGAWSLAHPEHVRLIADWRRRNQMAFPAVFNVTFHGTRKWFERRVVEDPERILYGIFDADDCLIGHAGLATFDWERGDCEIDNVMRGDAAAPKGLMTAVTNRLVAYAYDQLAAATVSLRVFGDNYQAVKLYRRCGFEAVESIPMGCQFEDAGVMWTAQNAYSHHETYRIFLRMRHVRP